MAVRPKQFLFIRGCRCSLVPLLVGLVGTMSTMCCPVRQRFAEDQASTCINIIQHLQISMKYDEVIQLHPQNMASSNKLALPWPAPFLP